MVRRRRLRLRAAVLGVLALLAAVVWPVTAGGAAVAQPGGRPAPTLVVGVAGLAWADVDRAGTPTLWSLLDRGSVASLTVRSVRARTCPVDGWLTIGAGRRAGDTVSSWCRALPEPERVGAGAAIRHWRWYEEAQEELPYDAVPGLLGQTLRDAGACVVAAGPGAALALADRSGRVHRYVPDASAVDAGLFGDCPVAVVDLGGLPAADDPARGPAASRLDAQLRALLDRVPGARIVVAGVADTAPTAVPVAGVDLPPLPPPGLRVAIDVVPGGDARWLVSPSTRWTGMVQLLDLSPMIATAAGVQPPGGFVGRAWQAGPPHPGDPREVLGQLVGSERAAQVFRTQSGPFFQLLGLAELLVLGLAYLTLRRRPGERRRRLVLRGLMVFTLAAAAFPVASFLANGVRWWRADRPGFVLWPTLLGIAVAVAVVAAVGPWRRRAYGPSTVVAGITAAVLAADVLTGSNLQHTSLLGLSPLVAGRFYGFGNIAYAVFAAGCLVLAAGLAQALLDRGLPRRAAAAVAGLVGLLAVVVGGAPFAGADFGGVVASVCGFGVLVVGVLDLPLTRRRALAVGAVAVLVVSVIAVLDWLRPPSQRSHFGEFVQSVVDGTAWTTIARKGSAAVGTLDRPFYGWLVPLVLVLIVLALRDPVRMRLEGLVTALAAWPLLRPLVWAGITVGVVGFAVNDSGIIVPALLLTVGIPLVVAATARAQLLRTRPHSGRG